MKKQLLVLLCLIVSLAKSQDLIKTKEGVDIPCRLQSVTPQLIKYINANNLQADSIITENVTELNYKDTLRVFVYPADARNKIELLDEANYKLLFALEDYGKALHSKTILNNVIYTGTTNNLTLESKKKLNVALNSFKNQKGVYWEISAHTDTVGKAAINQFKSEERAVAFINYLETQGFDIKRLKAVGKGEAEPLFFKAGEMLKNRRIELRATKIDKVSLLYWETYVPPKIVPKELPIMESSSISSDNFEQNSTEKKVVKTERIKKASSSGNTDNYKFAFIVGFSGINNLNETWKDDKKGIGLDKTGGLSTELVLRGKKVGISLGVGYYSWLLTRNFIYDDEKLYSATEKFTNIPLVLGLRLYFSKNLYLMPNAGYSLLNFKSNTDVTHPYPTLNQSDSSNSLSFGLNLGFEAKMKQVVANFALKYQYYNIQQSPSSINLLLNEPISFVGFTVGLGICN